MAEKKNVMEQLQTYSQHLQNILMQKQALQMQEKEMDRALAAMETAEEVYRSIGPLLLKSDKDETKTSLEDEKEDIALKLKTLETQEDKIREHVKKLQEEFQSSQKLVGQGG